MAMSPQSEPFSGAMKSISQLYFNNSVIIIVVIIFNNDIN